MLLQYFNSAFKGTALSFKWSIGPFWSHLYSCLFFKVSYEAGAACKPLPPQYMNSLGRTLRRYHFYLFLLVTISILLIAYFGTGAYKSVLLC
jgi:hypothetical protein